MNRVDLQKLAHTRAEDAVALLNAGRWAAAYYLAGYAVECALKACIARKFRAEDFPDKAIVLESYTHDLEKLVKTAKLQGELVRAVAADSIFESSWSVVEDWSEQSRYDQTAAGMAKAMVEAVVDPNHGVLQWLSRFY